jgi:geranylgeranyl diphosphate synthase type II
MSAFSELARLFGPQIEAALAARVALGEGCPAQLREAMRYSLLAPGKRLRPMLVLLAAKACGGSLDAAMPAACAVEMVHAYSLIHDDLPAMDDDDLRRGRPTCHKAFDEATAILAGDALLTLAFEVLAREIQPPAVAAACCAALAHAAGACNMVGGQADDVKEGERGQGAGDAGRADASLPSPASGRGAGGEGGSRAADPDISERPAERQGAGSSFDPSGAERVPVPVQTQALGAKSAPVPLSSRLAFLESIHARKTGAMIRVALRMGELTSLATSGQIEALDDYGQKIGLAFQITDDLLDVQSTEAVTGKRVGKDAEHGKLTYPGLLGIDQSTQYAEQLISQACHVLDPFGQAAEGLRTLARYVLERDH